MNAALAKSLTETQFQTMVIELAMYCGWIVFHPLPATVRSGQWATHMTGNKGFPDLVLARRRIVLLRELKTERGVVSKFQQRWIDEAGVQVWRPSDWDRIQLELR